MTTATTRTIARNHRRASLTALRIPQAAPREHCVFCAGFPVVVTSHGVETCPACHGS